MVAVAVPTADGVNVTEMVQVLLAASVPPTGQLLVCLKSAALAPEIVMLVIFSRKSLVFVRVEVLTMLVVPTVTVPKLSEFGVSEAVGRAPVPVRFKVLEPEEVLSVMVTLASCCPVAVGEKVTVMVQVAPGAKLFLQLLVCEYSEGLLPLRLTLLMVSVTTPLLVTVEVILLLL